MQQNNMFPEFLKMTVAKSVASSLYCMLICIFVGGCIRHSAFVEIRGNFGNPMSLLYVTGIELRSLEWCNKQLYLPSHHSGPKIITAGIHNLQCIDKYKLLKVIFSLK